MRRGNCYAASEALYRILGGRDAGWKCMRGRMPTDTHYFLQHESGLILDPSVLQFNSRQQSSLKKVYASAVGTGFLTKKPSKAATKIMEILTWQKK